MYIVGSDLIVQVLNAATGKLLRTFAPLSANTNRRGFGVTRGVTYGKVGANERIYAPIQNKIWCLDAKDWQAGPIVCGRGSDRSRKRCRPRHHRHFDCGHDSRRYLSGSVDRRQPDRRRSPARLRPDTFARTIFAPASGDGSFTRFRTRANSAMTPGPRSPGKRTGWRKLLGAG